jgi:hypothetical protein
VTGTAVSNVRGSLASDTGKERAMKIKKALETPVTMLFAEEYVEIHGLPGGGPVKLDPHGGSLDVTLDGYVVKLRVEQRETPEAATAGR